MKLTKIIKTTFVLLAITNSLHAQIRVNLDGTVNISDVISTEKNDTEVKLILGNKPTSYDNNDDVTFGVLGPFSEHRYGAKLAFGDYGKMSQAGANVFIGEFGLLDSDKLWLHGKNGFALTASGYANTLLCETYFHSGWSDYVFDFNKVVYLANGTYIGSDQEFKESIETVDSCLTKIQAIRGVSYFYKSENDSIDDVAIEPSAYKNLTKKEKEEIEFQKSINEKRKKNKKRRMGVIAQDVQQVFPELISQDSTGFLYVDYNGLIPVIIEAIKEQQELISNQQKEIALQQKEIQELKQSVNSLTKKNTNINALLKNNTIEALQYSDTELNISDILPEEAFLKQNTPNPFKYSTQIECFIPKSFENAQIHVFNLQGGLLLSFDVTSSGKSIIEISGTELSPGMYIYSLIVEGSEVDTKRMILTK